MIEIINDTLFNLYNEKISYVMSILTKSAIRTCVLWLDR